MKKKIISVLCTAVILIGCFMFAACSPNEAKSIEITGGVFTDYEIGEQINLADINVKVKMTNGQELNMTAASSGVSVTGFDSSVANLNGKVTVSYQTVSVEVPYKVYSTDHFIYSSSDLTKITSATSPSTLIIKNAGAYDLSSYVINRDLTLIGRLGKNIILKDASTSALATDEAINVSIKNCKITTDDADCAVKFDTKRTTGDFDKFELSNCEVIANGVDKGVIIPARCNMLMTGCTFTTPTENDVFAYLFSGNSAKKDLNGKLEITNCTFICAFNYGLFDTIPDKFEGNYVEGKLTASSVFTAEGSGQKYFVPLKNPVWFHSQIQYSALNADANATQVYSVKNNTFKNLESLMRVYNYDRVNNKSQINMTFENNTFDGINVLLINSQASYTGVSTIFNKITENNTKTTGYNVQTRTVIEKNTTIDFSATPVSVTKTRNGKTVIYYDLANNNGLGAIYQTKNTTDDANKYVYVGSGALSANGSILGTTSTGGERHVLRDSDGKFYVVVIEYSADGKDNVKYYNGAGFYAEKNEALVFNLDQTKEMLGWTA